MSEVQHMMQVHIQFQRDKEEKMIPGSVLAAMNNDISKVRKQGDIYECGGTFLQRSRYLKSVELV